MLPTRTERFQLSPFYEKYERPDFMHGVYAGRIFSFTGATAEEDGYWTLRRQAALYDVPERPVEITGPDSLAVLEKVFSRPIADLGIGRGRYAIACLEDGGVLMDGVLFRLAADRYWYVKADGEFDLWLMAHAVGLNATVRDPDAWVLQIQGPTSGDVLSALTKGAIDAGFKYFHSGFFDIGGCEMLVSRTGWTGELGYELYVPVDDVDCPALWDLILEAGAPFGLSYCEVGSMNLRRVEAGILDNRSDMDETMTPFAAGLGAFVDLDKSDFIGREALLKADRRRRLFGVICEGETPRSGLRVASQSEICGEITTGGWSPFLRKGIGYVRFETPGDWTAQPVSLLGEDGAAHRCEVIEPPFYDPEKRIPRGVDREIP